MAEIRIPVSKGTCTGIGASLHEYLTVSEGVSYNPNDPAAHKMGGRTKFNASAVSSDNLDNGLFFDPVSGSASMIVNSRNGNLYRSTLGGGAFSSIWDWDGSHTISEGSQDPGNAIDGVVFNDQLFVAPCNGGSGSYSVVVKNTGTVYRHGMVPVNSAPGLSQSGTGITGTFQYWVTEYDSTNLVESAYHNSVYGSSATASGTQPANKTITVTRHTTVQNTNADKWRIYRTIDNGAFPIGWLVAEVAIGTTTYDDTTTDSDLVLNDPYEIITINGIPESMNMPPTWNVSGSGFNAIDAFNGSIIGTFGDSLYFSPSGYPHAFPYSYRVRFGPLYGGSASCVRTMGPAAYVFFPNETFRVNYLPDETDAVFNTGVCQEKIANFGTPSSRGACVFSSWGGSPLMFVASNTGPMLIATGETAITDRAVVGIDWANTITPSRLSSCDVIDNPAKSRVELSYLDSNDDWWALHFYYDNERLIRGSGPLPKLAWTGPHPIPGPTVYAVSSNSGGTYSASHLGDGYVYVEDSGTTDAALLTDASGSVPFTLKTARKYPEGFNREFRADRLYIHKEDTSDTDYSYTFTAYREEANATNETGTIDAGISGITSDALQNGGKSFEITIDYTNTATMPAINSITVETEDVTKSAKANVGAPAE